MPTSKDNVPGRDMADLSGSNANCADYDYSPTPIDGGKFLTVVGEFQNSASPYGTFDQAGNVEEWNESVIEFGSEGLTRGYRGGSFANSPLFTIANFRVYTGLTYDATVEYSSLGFRVVSTVPEPSSLILLTTAAVLLPFYLWRKRVARVLDPVR